MPNATLRSVEKLDTLQVKHERATTISDSTAVVPAASAANYEIVFKRLSTRARIHGNSSITWDDLASSGAPTLDLGFKAVAANFTTDVDALNDGLTLATATVRAAVIKTHTNSGKMVWELLGLSSDPGGFADVIGTVLDASTVEVGSVTMTLSTSID